MILKMLEESIMSQAKKGDMVKVHYTGRLNDGTVFDTSKNRQPLQFTIGQGQVIAGVEEAVDGMNAGESKTATIPQDKAYGARREEMVVVVDRKQLPEELNPKVGQRLELTQENDQSILVTVTDLTDASITLDANHPLAGKDLVFDLELVEIA